MLKCSISVLHMCCPSVKPAPVAVAAQPPLKEDDFPSLSAVTAAPLMTPVYSGQPKKASSFLEEDFPALVSKIRPHKPAAGTNSAWSNNAAVSKSVSNPPPSSRPTPPLSSAASAPQLLCSSTSSSSRRKKKVGENVKAAFPRSPPSSDDESGGMTQQEFRSVPTMLDISSLLTVKGDNSKPSPVTPSSSNPAPNASLLAAKGNKKKKPQKTTAAASASASSLAGMTTPVNTISVETVAQKENVPEKNVAKPLSSGLANGQPEKSPPLSKKADTGTVHYNTDPPLQKEEEFPALITKKPPPGWYNIQNSGAPRKNCGAGARENLGVAHQLGLHAVGLPQPVNA